MLGDKQNSRRYTDKVELTKAEYTIDGYGHTSIGSFETVFNTLAEVRRMSDSKTLMTFQSAEVIGLDIEMWRPSVAFNGMRWKGHDIFFNTPEEIKEGRALRIQGYYHKDHLKI